MLSRRTQYVVVNSGVRDISLRPKAEMANKALKAVKGAGGGRGDLVIWSKAEKACKGQRGGGPWPKDEMTQKGHKGHWGVGKGGMTKCLNIL